MKRGKAKRDEHQERIAGILRKAMYPQKHFAQLPVGTECWIYPDANRTAVVTREYGPVNVEGEGIREGYTVRTDGSEVFCAAGELIARSSERKFSHLRRVK